MGRTGDCCDNALAESINGLYQVEWITCRTPWKTKPSMELETLQQASGFNHHRLFEPIGPLPPAKAEATDDRQPANQATAAAA